MDQFILFGDSITQQAFSQENNVGFLGPALCDAYVRRLDIINRGFSGYNTKQALQILPKFMPTPQQAHVRFMLILFGANDARLPDTAGGAQQYVPRSKFVDNLRTIVQHPCVRAHQDIRIILVTPPPIDERKTMEEDREKYGLGNEPRRTAVRARKYAAAVRELAEELELPILDLWLSMMVDAGFDMNGDEELIPGSRYVEKNDILQDYLRDGLHLSREAYKILFEELMRLIEREWPEEAPEKIPFAFPTWDDELAWSGEA